MMIYKIHYDGDYRDYIIIEGNDIEEIRKKAQTEIQARGWNEEDCWSEDLSEVA